MVKNSDCTFSPIIDISVLIFGNVFSTFSDLIETIPQAFKTNEMSNSNNSAIQCISYYIVSAVLNKTVQ
jgi:hypothetical protein